MPKTQHKSGMIQTLEKLGLSENEALLYPAMLRHPESTAQELSVRSPFSRTMLYHVLNQLAQRGLVSERKNKGRTVYIAEDPDKLYDLLSQKENEFEAQQREIRELIPSLKSKYRLSGRRPGVRVFEGIEEYKKALEEIIISKPQRILSYETLDKNKPGLEVREAFEKKRITKKIEKHVLFFESKKAHEYIAKRAYDDVTRFRSVSKEDVDPFEADCMLYDGKILYTSYDEREPTAVLIEDKAFHAMQENLFTTLWQQGTDVSLITPKQ